MYAGSLLVFSNESTNISAYFIAGTIRVTRQREEKCLMHQVIALLEFFAIDRPFPLCDVSMGDPPAAMAMRP
jgi:hypothetical protein